MKLQVTTIIWFLFFLCQPVSLIQAQDVSVCTVCGKKLGRDFVEIEEKYYHSKCFTCDYCNEPIPDSFTRYEGKNYHTQCFEAQIATRCDVCEGIIKGKYISNFWGNAYHPEHEGKEIQCSFCRRFIVGTLAEKSVVFQDGRHYCGECNSTAVFESGEAKSLLIKVAEWLSDFGLEADPGLIEVSLVNKDALRRLGDRESRDARGFIDHEVTRTLSGEVTHQTTRMYLLYGMPKTEMIGAIAHELTHVWMFRQAGKEREKAIVEGSCNFSAYLVLKKIGTDQAMFIIDNMQNNPDPVYGKGFRRIKRYVEVNGLDGWRRLIKDPHQKASL